MELQHNAEAAGAGAISLISLLNRSSTTRTRSLSGAPPEGGLLATFDVILRQTQQPPPASSKPVHPTGSGAPSAASSPRAASQPRPEEEDAVREEEDRRTSTVQSASVDPAVITTSDASAAADEPAEAIPSGAEGAEQSGLSDEEEAEPVASEDANAEPPSGALHSGQPVPPQAPADPEGTSSSSAADDQATPLTAAGPPAGTAGLPQDPAIWNPAGELGKPPLEGEGRAAGPDEPSPASELETATGEPSLSAEEALSEPPDGSAGTGELGLQPASEGRAEAESSPRDSRRGDRDSTEREGRTGDEPDRQPGKQGAGSPTSGADPAAQERAVDRLVAQMQPLEPASQPSAIPATAITAPPVAGAAAAAAAASSAGGATESNRPAGGEDQLSLQGSESRRSVGSVKKETGEGQVNGASNAARVRLVQRVARAFQRLGPTGGRVQVMLHPAELGSVRLELRIEGNRLDASLTAETEAARSVLREHLPELRQKLADSGLVVERMDVDVEPRTAGEENGRGQGQDERDPSRRGSGFTAPPGRRTPPPSPAPARSHSHLGPSRSRSGLDLMA